MRPTCCASLLVAAALPAQTIDARVHVALEQARPALLHHLARAELGELALCCLAACHDGVPFADPVFTRAIDKLSRAAIDDTYGLAIRLLVLAEHPDFPQRAQVAKRDTALLRRRQTTGGYSYGEHDGWWDLSNTQYAALGLRAAVALGMAVPEAEWRVLHAAVADMQHEDGAFTYRPGQGRTSAYVSMTVAGIAVLAVCAQMLPLDARERTANDERIARAWQWLGERGSAIGERRTHNSHYFLYGLERAAILTDVQRVGNVDWYEAGARLLCDEQLGGGGFWGQDEMRAPAQRSAKGHAVDTAFAVLFLRRRFAKVQAPTTGGRQCASAALTDPASDAAVRDAARADATHGEWALPQLVPLLRSEIAARRRAAVLAIFAITRSDFGIHPWRAPADDSTAIARAERWWDEQRPRR